ncbi:unnamed protein product [Owenia fusiformis]|uniref:C2H2-type domain-containing protein n=2 Tax=Owenia fusiformis TaxID=6347 RepID=A0A8S4MV76_OWEFU|nr:unnamed protein product [Owenia fusiformis]
MGELSQSCKRISLRIQLLFDDVQSLTDAEQEQIMEIIRVRLDEWQALKGLDYPTEKLSERADPNPTPPKMAKLTTNLQGRKENLLSQKPTPSISPTKPHTITTVASPTKAPQTLTSVTPRTVDMHNNLVEMDSEPVDHNNQISNELDINSFGRDTSNSQDTSTLIDAIKQEYEDDDNDETDDVNYDSNFTDISIKTESDINNSIDQVKEEQIEDDDCVPPESLKKPTGKSKRKMSTVRTYICPEDGCLFRSTRKWNLQEHQKNVHSNPAERPLCDTCGRHFKNKRGLILHLKYDHENRLMCSACPKTFGTQSGLDEHFSRIHKGEGKIFICNEDGCVKFFRRNQALESHINSCHRKCYEFACPNLSCERKFPCQKKLNAHKVECGKKFSVTCTKCDKKFNTYNGMNDHRRAMHGSETYRCECGKVYTFRSGLAAHLKKFNHRKV